MEHGTVAGNMCNCELRLQIDVTNTSRFGYATTTVLRVASLKIAFAAIAIIVYYIHYTATCPSANITEYI